jgi:hypothetical protein
MRLVYLDGMVLSDPPLLSYIWHVYTPKGVLHYLKMDVPDLEAEGILSVVYAV